MTALRSSRWRLPLQLLISAGLIGLLVWLARSADLGTAFRSIDAGTLLLATTIYTLAALLNGWRWQRLLQVGGIREPLPRLIGLYLSGMFCSLFLPSSVGGDALRVVGVSRRGWPALRVILAVWQERLLGLGVTLMFGLAATLTYLHLLPSAFSVFAITLQLSGLLAVLALLNPIPLLSTLTWLSRRAFIPRRVQALREAPLMQKVASKLSALREVPPLRARELFPLVLVASASFILCVGVCPLLGEQMGITLGLWPYCMIIPLVWVVKLLPVSFNGVGVGEGALVFLLGLFGVPPARALVLALALLAVQTSTALLGGLVLLKGVLVKSRTAEVPPAEPLQQAA